MPDWLIWLAAFWLVFGCGAGCRRAWSHRRLSAGAGSTGTDALRSEREHPTATGSIAPGTPPSAVLERGSAAPEAEPETPLASLQRRFVDGALTLEQYEAAVDRLDRKELG
jgi:hypothetical protein